MIMRKTEAATAMFNDYRNIVYQSLLIFIVSTCLLFAGCGSDSNGDGSPAETPINLSDTEKLDLAKSVLYVSYAGIGYSNKEDQVNAPLYNVMIGDLNLLTMALADRVLDLQDFISELEENGTLDKNILTVLFEVYTWWMSKSGYSNTVSASYKDVNITITLTGLDRSLIASLLSSDAFNASLTLTLKADFNTSGFNLASSPECIYKGIDGQTDFEAFVELNISSDSTGNMKADIQAAKLITHESLSALYSPTHDVQYNNWNISYGIDMANYLNAHLIPLFIDLFSDREDSKDNRDYIFTGGFSLNSQTYETTSMHYIQEAQDDGTSIISIEGDIRVPEEDISVGVSSNSIIRDSKGVWTGGWLDITIGQEIINIDFNADDSAKISSSETVSNWQQDLDPLK